MSIISSDSADLVKKALSFQAPDRLPVFINAFWDEFTAIWRQRDNSRTDIEIEDYFGNGLCVPVAREEFFPSRMGEIERKGDDVFSDDGWGRIIRTKKGTTFYEVAERLLKTPKDLEAIEFEPADLSLRYNDFLKEVTEQRRKGRAVFIKIGGPFIRSTFFRGETDFLMDLLQDESFAIAIVEKVADHLLQVGLESLRRADAYEFGVWIFDDMCNISAPMFSPKTFERIFLPVYKRLVSALKAAGARWVILHCDGNLSPLLDLLIEAGIDGINPVEPAAGLNIPELMDKYHGRLSFIGGLCNTKILPGNNPDRIRQHVEETIEAGKNGGLVLGTHSIGPDVSLENFELLRQIITTKGCYRKKSEFM